MNTSLSNSSSENYSIESAVDIVHFASCVVITLLSFLGNTFVIVAIAKNHNLRTVSNYFVSSLAVTDVFVSILILPLGLQYLFLRRWYIGRVLCTLWVSIDVLLITASILSLCAISIDRYRAINQPIKYAVRRTPTLAGKIIGAVWSLSFLVSVPSVFVIDYSNETLQCGIQRNAAFAICSSFVSFYGPLFVVLFVYVKIYRAAKKRAAMVGNNFNTVSMVEFSIEMMKPQLRRQTTLQRLRSTLSRANVFQSASEGASSTSRISTTRERKAARTIAIIVGVFIACWLPFFVMHVTLSVCDTCNVSEQTYIIISWIGYWNSALNPIIYTLFNKDFRRAFSKMLRCKSYS